MSKCNNFRGAAWPDNMASILNKAGFYWDAFKGRLTVRRDREPIDSVARLQEFVSTRSVFVAQKTLYSYVKMRMGTRYPRMFEDDMLIVSVDIAKHHVFAGCLSDLAIYAVAIALHEQPVSNDDRRALALQCFEAALREISAEAPEQFSAQEVIDEFGRRLELTDWRVGALHPDNFTASPRALYRWAPIADRLKKFDAEIVENSVRYNWRDIREQYHKRLDAAALCANWSRQTAG